MGSPGRKALGKARESRKGRKALGNGREGKEHEGNALGKGTGSEALRKGREA